MNSSHFCSINILMGRSINSCVYWSSPGVLASGRAERSLPALSCSSDSLTYRDPAVSHARNAWDTIKWAVEIPQDTDQYVYHSRNEPVQVHVMRRYIPGPIWTQGEADMQAQSELIDVDVEIPGRE
jgi:hypothetical protein